MSTPACPHQHSKICQQSSQWPCWVHERGVSQKTSSIYYIREPVGNITSCVPLRPSEAECLRLRTQGHTEQWERIFTQYPWMYLMSITQVWTKYNRYLSTNPIIKPTIFIFSKTFTFQNSSDFSNKLFTFWFYSQPHIFCKTKLNTCPYASAMAVLTLEN